MIILKVKSERERQIPYDIICMWTLKFNKKRQMNKYKKTETENKLVVTGGKGQISEGD